MVGNMKHKILIEIEVSSDLGPNGLEHKVEKVLQELNTRTVSVLRKEIRVYKV